MYGISEDLISILMREPNRTVSRHLGLNPNLFNPNPKLVVEPAILDLTLTLFLFLTLTLSPPFLFPSRGRFLLPIRHVFFLRSEASKPKVSSPFCFLTKRSF